MWRLLLLFILSVAFIALKYAKEKSLKKTLVAVVLLLYIFSIGYSAGILTRAVAPLFFAHIITLIAAYIGFILYLFKDRFLWYLLLLPILPLLFYILLNYIDGSRYEAIGFISLYLT